MSWFRVTRGRLEYRGRITREPFAAWTTTREGADAMARAARDIRFALFGRIAKATTVTWRALERAARSEPLVSALGGEADRFMALMADLSYMPLLPSARVSLQRIIVVPRATIAGRARDALCSRIGALAAMAEFDDAVRAFFFARLVREMDSAVVAAAPSPAHPVHATGEWACIGVDRELQWIDPTWTGPGWGGHLYMYEFPREGLAKKERREVEATLKGMRDELAELSHVQRHDLLRTALDRGSALRGV